MYFNTWICRTAVLSVGTLGSAKTCLRSRYVFGLEWSRERANALSDVVHRRPLSFLAMAPRSWDMKNCTCSLDRKPAMVVRSSRSFLFCVVAAESWRSGARIFGAVLLFSLYTCRICMTRSGYKWHTLKSFFLEYLLKQCPSFCVVPTCLLEGICLTMEGKKISNLN